MFWQPYNFYQKIYILQEFHFLRFQKMKATIEAARAGEAGKGFAVVATEVGNLANNTQDSLNEVESVIKRVQSNVKEIKIYVEENSQKLDKQNEYYANVFKSMKNMTELLNVSVSAINTMGDAHNKQAEVVKNTVSINHDIIENIKNENEQFLSINGLVILPGVRPVDNNTK